MEDIKLPKDSWGFVVLPQEKEKALYFIPSKEQYRYSEILTVFMASIRFTETLGKVLELYAANADQVNPDTNNPDLNWKSFGF